MAAFETALAAFVQAAQGMVNAHYQSAPHMKAPTLEVMRGERYVRIIATEKTDAGAVLGRQAWAFVEIATGHILKPASWEQPAKHARGSIYNANPLDGCGEYGPAYIRR